jgi:hypothetical protein
VDSKRLVCVLVLENSFTSRHLCVCYLPLSDNSLSSSSGVSGNSILIRAGHGLKPWPFCDRRTQPHQTRLSSRFFQNILIPAW